MNQGCVDTLQITRVFRNFLFWRCSWQCAGKTWIVCQGLLRANSPVVCEMPWRCLRCYSWLLSRSDERDGVLCVFWPSAAGDVMSVRNRKNLTQDLRDVLQLSNFVHFVRNGLGGRVGEKKAFVCKKKLRKKSKVCQVTQKLHLKSVLMGLIEW